MQQQYAVFYRDMGVRRFNDLLSPRLNVMKAFPRDSVYHHLTDDESTYLDATKGYLDGFTGKIPVDFVFKSPVMVGKPRELTVQTQTVAMSFIREHRAFRFLKGAATLWNDPRIPVVVNYNTLKMSYRFPTTPMAPYWEWESFHRALFAGINEVADRSPKHHFVIFEPIQHIPSIGLLRDVGNKEGTTMARVFNTPDKRLVLHLFNFLEDERREKSALGLLRPENLSKVNLVFQTRDGRSSVMNLGYLFSFIKGHPDVSGGAVKTQYDGLMVRKALLMYLMTLSATVPDEETIPETEEKKDLRQDDPEDRPDVEMGDEPGEDLLPMVAKDVKIPDTPVSSSENELLDRLDDDLQILESKNRAALLKQGIVIKNGEVQEIDNVVSTLRREEIVKEIQTPLSPTDALKKKLKTSLEEGNITAAAYRKAVAEAEKYAMTKDPYGSGRTLRDMVIVNPDALKIERSRSKLVDNPTVFNKSMVESSLQNYTSDYVSKHLREDVLKMVASLQKGGITIQSHEVEIENTVTGSAELHNLVIKPLNGASSSIWFRLPVVEENGTYRVSNNTYILKKQRVDLPIRKISPTEVGLSSYYGKTFVSTENKMAASSSDWIIRQINKASFEGSDWIKSVMPGDTFDSYRNTPYIYGLLSTQFRSLIAGEIQFKFDGLPPDNIPKAPGLTWCGVRDVKGQMKLQHVFVGDDDIFRLHDGGKLIVLGDIYEVLKLDAKKAPIRFSELALFKKNVPVGIVLGYRLGWTALLTLLKAPYRVLETGKRLNLLPHEYPVVFRDRVYVFSQKDKLASMILSGFTDYEKVTKQYDSKEFEHPDVYLNLMTSKGLGAIYIREIDMLFDFFVDPITQEILQDMKEPTTFEGLLLRSSEMLLSYQHPKNNDGAFTRIRGYERLAGAVYRELTASVRQFRSKNIAGRSKVDISPWKVWQSINDDPTKFMVPEINPIQDTKNDEGVTYVGEGGRSKDAINKASRSYHQNDIGVVSESTVDSSDVGVNIYTPADPVFKNLRGLADKRDIQTANRFSTSMLLAPCAMNDSANRQNFISIQQSHTVPAIGYHAPMVRTGYESLIAQRTNPLFAYCAKDDGKVVEVSDLGVIVEYKDKKRVGLKTGREFGRAEGSIFPFFIESAVRKGQSFKKGAPIVYNTSYFEPDYWNPGQLVMKNSMTCKTVLWETKQTFEDASALSKKLSERMGTQTTYERTFIVTFEQNVHHLVKMGQTTVPSDILMTIEDEITANLGSFGDGAMDTLKGLSKQSPKANYHGTVDRIEVFYHGEKDQMSPTLRKLSDQSDAFLKMRADATEKPRFTGQVTNDFRVDGTPLGLNKAAIRFYITVKQGMGVADKSIFANQMKSVNAQVMDYQMYTENGEEIEAVFGCKSIAARNVMSPYKIGTTITLLKLFAREVVTLYQGK